MTIDRQWPWPSCRLQAVVGPMPGARGCQSSMFQSSITDINDVPPCCVCIWASGPHARPHACMHAILRDAECFRSTVRAALAEKTARRRRRGGGRRVRPVRPSTGRRCPAVSCWLHSLARSVHRLCLWHIAPTSRCSHAYARAEKASSCGWGAFSPLRRHLQITDGNAARAWASTHRASGEWRVALVSQLRSSLCKMAMPAPICMARASGAAIRRRGRDP